MKLGLHRLLRWVVPLGLPVLGLLLAVVAARCFPDVAWLPPNGILGAFVVMAVFGLAVVERLAVACPRCGTRLDFHHSRHSAVPSYRCDHCGFFAR